MEDKQILIDLIKSFCDKKNIIVCNYVRRIPMRKNVSQIKHEFDELCDILVHLREDLVYDIVIFSINYPTTEIWIKINTKVSFDSTNKYVIQESDLANMENNHLFEKKTIQQIDPIDFARSIN